MKIKGSTVGMIAGFLIMLSGGSMMGRGEDGIDNFFGGLVALAFSYACYSTEIRSANPGKRHILRIISEVLGMIITLTLMFLQKPEFVQKGLEENPFIYGVIPLRGALAYIKLNFIDKKNQ